MRLGFWSALFLSVAMVALLGFGLNTSTAPRGASSSGDADVQLVFYCAAGIQPPVKAAVDEYEQKYDRRVDLEYGGSGHLLSRIDVARIGDLYLAADDSYIDIAREKGLVAESLPLATQRACLAVPRGNPLGITSLDSLTADSLRIGLANPEAAAVGRISKQILERSGLWDDVQRAVESRGVFKPTVTDLANDLKLGSIDVAILWDTTAAQYPEIDSIVIDPSLHEAQNITIGVLAGSKHPTEALHFARFLAARDAGLLHFEREGYTPVLGDVWAEHPRLTVFIGGVLRPAVERTIADFSEREGVEIVTVYNGCGILVGQMKTGSLPDAYFACDRSFMGEVSDLFDDPLEISRTRMVIAVPEGNPRNITGLADLEADDLQIGVCNAQQSALGALTDRLLRETGHYDGVMKNVVSQVPTADLLVTQLRAGGLDAAIIYEANYARVKEHLDAISLPASAAIAVQPLAVANKSDAHYLASRLVDQLRSRVSQKRFVDSGFEWVSAIAESTAKTP